MNKWPSFDDHFNGPTLDTSIWFPHYLPAWSLARRHTAPAYSPRRAPPDPRRPGRPPGVVPWRPHAAAAGLRDPVRQLVRTRSAAAYGQQRFREGQVVREEQQRFEGWLPTGGRVAIRARMALSPRSMAALWMSGFEDDPEQLRCGELCVFEIFGNALEAGREPRPRWASGIKAFRDPALTQDFAAPRVAIDVTDLHTYAVDWDADEAVFTVDGQEVRRCPRPPTYPLQLMLAVFDFPEWSVGDDDHLVPELVVDRVWGGLADSGAQRRTSGPPRCSGCLAVRRPRPCRRDRGGVPDRAGVRCRVGAHRWPFQRITRDARRLPCPTAYTLVGDSAVTPARRPPCGDGTSVRRPRSRLRPSQCSANGTCQSCASGEGRPTAHTSSRASATTPSSEASRPVGVGTMLQANPSQCMASGARTE